MPKKEVFEPEAMEKELSTSVERVPEGEWKTVCRTVAEDWNEDEGYTDGQRLFKLQQHTGTKEIRVIPAGE